MNDKTIKLKTNRVDLFNLKEKTQRSVVDGRRARYDNPIIAADKNVVAAVLEDYAVMMRALKRYGMSFNRPLHHSETAEWKSTRGKSAKLSDIPVFLRGNRKREKL